MIQNFSSIHIDNDSVKVDISFDDLALRVNEAQKWLDHKVFEDTVPYIPMDTGNMTESARRASLPLEGTGEVVVGDTPYAKYQYNGISRFTGLPLNYQKIHHPLATDHWFEASLRDHEKAWVEGVKNIIYGR